MPMAVKLGRVGIYNEELPFINLQGTLITWSRKFFWKIKSVISVISTITKPVPTELDKVGTYYEKLPPISRDFEKML